MINNIPKPNISLDFTVDDIHKIREWHYERLKDASFDEYLEDITNGSNSFLRRMEDVNRNLA